MDTAQRAWGKPSSLRYSFQQLTNVTPELDNNIKLVDPKKDKLYTYGSVEQQQIQALHPWRKDAKHFKNVRISAVALLKMVMHARSGGHLEVMGLMQGKISGDTFIVTDAFRLPVEGTETRVNAGDEANEYIVNYLQACRDSGKEENAVGWYHSHPGYGCWLSGIDVGTQHNYQSFSDPWLAVVIDPDRTISAGKVEIGAFRTYPEGYKEEGATTSDGYQSIPLAKAEDFGAHASRYYELNVSHYKSTLDTQLLDLLWNKYWAQTLSQNPLTANGEYTSKQIADLADKIELASKRDRGDMQASAAGQARKKEEMERCVREGGKIAGEEKIGLLSAEVKAKLFNGLAKGKVVTTTDEL